MWTGLAMLAIVFTCRDDPHQAVIVRVVAMIFMGTHGVLHLFFLNLLHHFRRKGLVEADVALLAYCSPRRITHLDLAILWGVLATAVHLFCSLVPAATGSG